MGWFLLGLMLGVVFGNWYAHHYVATECERLGKFFVGKKVFIVGEIINIGKETK